MDPCPLTVANPVQGPGQRQQEHHVSAQECRINTVLGAVPPGAPLPHTAPLPARAHPGTAGIGQMSPGNLCLHVSHSSVGTSSNRSRSIHPAVIEIYSQVFNMHAGPSCSLRLAGIQQGFDGWLWQKTRVLIFLLS